MSLKQLADKVRSEGRGKDTMLVHLTPKEVGGLQALAQSAGGSLTINPKTGLPEAGVLDSLLPSLLGFAANFVLPGSGMIVGGLTGAAQAKKNDQNPLMGALLGGMGGYGGGQFAQGLNTMGASATANAAVTPAAQVAGQTVVNPALQQAALSEGLKVGGAEAAQAALQGAQGAGIPQLLPAATEVAPRTAEMLAGEYSAAQQAFMDKPFYERFGPGVRAAMDNPQAYLNNVSPTLKGQLRAGAMTAAPTVYQSMMPKPFTEEEDDTVLPRYDYTAGLTGNYYGTGGDGGTYERGYFTQPTFTRRAASGGIMSLAEGGATDPKDVAQGMTGASADAMRYLMGQSAVSPATLAARELPAPVAQTPTPAEQTPSRSGVGIFMGKKPAASTPKFTFDPQTGQYTRLPDPVVARTGGAKTLSELFGFVPDQGSFAQGGLAELARGGMKAGGFVIPADVVSMVGEGNTDSGYEQIKRMLPGATPIKGKDGGQADTVKTSIEGKQPARIAHGEMYVPPATVKRAGGAKKLYAMMNNVRKQAKGDAKQIKPVNLKKALA